MAVMERDLKITKEQADKAVEQWVKTFWHLVDKDTAGDPQARWMAVGHALKLRVAGVGPRKAALMFDRPIGSNAVQRYFDTARFYQEKLISQEEIKELGITGCAALGRERFQKKNPSSKRRVDRITKARRAYAQIRSLVINAEKFFNIKVLLRMYSTSPRGIWQDDESVKLV